MHRDQTQNFLQAISAFAELCGIATHKGKGRRPENEKGGVYLFLLHRKMIF